MSVVTATMQRHGAATGMTQQRGDATARMQRHEAATTAMIQWHGGLHEGLIVRASRGPLCAAASSSSLTPLPLRTRAIANTNTILVITATDRQ